MREKDVHKLIEQQDSELKQRILSNVKSQVDVQPVVVNNKPVAKRIAWKWAAACFALVCVITLSVVLPLTLKDDGGGVRFCNYEQYITENLGQTVKEYSDSQNKSLLYVDWYDVAEDVNTIYGYNKKDKSDIIYITETIVNGETGEIVSLSVTDNKTQVDIFEQYLTKENVINVKDITVNYRVYNHIYLLSMFDYQNHTYYLQTDAENGTESLTAIIEGMLK